ncbi:MAG: class I SAM-dependent methyltransferase [Chitinophagaceae bacterium]|nr:class I SAM-dependent methyltransferase [Chitinophagaceae bacterium]
MAFSSLHRWVRFQNPKFSFLKKSFGNKPFRILDIGTGNHSATKTKSLFPACDYYGLDLNKDYNNDADDFKVMSGFYEMDLTHLDFSSLPDHFFDAIWLVHVIEHLHNGDKVLEGLVRKLNPGGYMYIEYPGKTSMRLPSMKGTLNFTDDTSHVRLYSIEELQNLFISNNFSIIKSGSRRSLFYAIATPGRIIFRWIRAKAVTGNIFWDLLGFAEFLWVKKN